ncbi:HEAT repeat domain-containing protein [Streptomyces galilaeus]|uniref:HEAT repeat domain-containing protein n=1 Tax=Streptomyces galilaeus TaxID=33899 RepID=UPI0038F6B3CB
MTTPRESYALFLRRQASQAGLGPQAIADRFREEARKQEEQAANTGKPPQFPISTMHCSKSHIHRLFKAEGHPHPPKPFTRQFLKITSTAAGLTLQQHNERWAEAERLLTELADSKAVQRTQRRPEAPVSSLREDDVARLHLELELARAHHNATCLRHALEDTRLLVVTLWQIISALRDIISNHDAFQARPVLEANSPARLTLSQDEREQALEYKRTAQDEADQAYARTRVLEERWDRACAELHRLSLHPLQTAEADDSTALDPVLPSWRPQELLARPALDDIKAALDKAHLVNIQEEDAARELLESMSASGPFAPDDERLVLVAATRLSDADSRRIALGSLTTGWPSHPDTRDALLRLAADPAPEVRLRVAEGLAECWGGDRAARDTLVSLAQDVDEHVRQAIPYSVLSAGWRSEHALHLLLRLTHDPEARVRASAAIALTAEWTQSTATRDALLRLLLDPETVIREQAVEGLMENWLVAPETCDGLLRLVDRDQDSESVDVVAAFAGVLAHWFHAAKARSAVLRLDPREPLFRRIGAETLRRWRGNPTARGSVILMSGTDDAAVLASLPAEAALHAAGEDLRKDAAERAAHFRSQAVKMLFAGWAGDTVARDAVLQRVDDPVPQVRTAVAVALVFGWPHDDAAGSALDRLAQDHDGYVQAIVKVELRWGSEDGTPSAPAGSGDVP